MRPGVPMSIHAKGPGKWRVVIQHKGRRHDSIVTGTKQAARVAEADLRMKVETDALQRADPRSTPTFAVFSLHSFKPYAKIHFRANTWRRLKYQLPLLAEHFGDMRLTEIDQTAVQNYKTGRMAGGVGAAVINSDLRVLTRVLRYAKDECGMPVTTVKIRALPEKGQSRAHAWSGAELDKLIVSCLQLSPAIVPIVVFVANVGCRKGEALALTWERIDLERRMVRFWPSDEWQPKNGKPREAPIPDEMLLWLQRGKHDTTDPVFPCPRTGRRFASWPQLQFDRARDAAGLKGGPHTLRHTFASLFLARGGDIYDLSRILGHDDIKTTYQHYAHMLPENLERARNRVNIAMPMPPAELAFAIRCAESKRKSDLGIRAGKASAAKRAMRSLPETLPEADSTLPEKARKAE